MEVRCLSTHNNTIIVVPEDELFTHSVHLLEFGEDNWTMTIPVPFPKSIAACNESNIAAVSSSLTPPASDQQHQQVVTMMGMDRATIESYPKTLVEDQLAPPSDEMCPICMSEYRSKETLRTIPKCNH
ncbi:hypothetical protein CRG98_001704 [Punica granatum]|uniref:RING-type domain-containing protein n=1 Tax=Punica granatum TaxID=22663 RepID=A0A2I0LB63_PUNGR|nr:hypothetical protein CRG98_001704 [Punica granatum]